MKMFAILLTALLIVTTSFSAYAKEVDFYSTKQFSCFNFAPGGYEIIDLENKRYCRIGGTDQKDNCLGNENDFSSVSEIKSTRQGLLKFGETYVEFLEIILKDHSVFKIFKPLAPDERGEMHHHAELIGVLLTTDPFEKIRDTGLTYGCSKLR